MDMPSSVVLELDADGAGAAAATGERRGTDATATARDSGTGFRLGGTWGLNRLASPGFTDGIGGGGQFTGGNAVVTGFDLPKRRPKKLRTVLTLSP
ncbi:hypothetical protein N234_31712 [Ralstonia pickettii DTP0602]|nr:hypothetical protein N234_31712 [Ralstonia pickettii DTP0602]